MSKEFKEITGNRAAMRGLGIVQCALSIEKGCTRIIYRVENPGSIPRPPLDTSQPGTVQDEWHLDRHNIADSNFASDWRHSGRRADL